MMQKFHGYPPGRDHNVFIFGHDAMRKLQLCVDDWATGLDTGAVYGNNLTDIILPRPQPYFGTVEKEILVTQIKNQREKLSNVYGKWEYSQNKCCKYK